jgi:hypothetical protein
MSNLDVFLSHKAKDGELAKSIQRALTAYLPSLRIFLSEEITKAEDFRDDIWAALEKSKFFILLYTDPVDDWSWCFFEVGAYRSIWRNETRRNEAKRNDIKSRHPVYCLHSRETRAPSPLANLQTIRADSADITRWLRDICTLLGRKLPAEKKMKLAAERIENAMKARLIFDEQTIKPYIWITPRPPRGASREIKAGKQPEAILEEATVAIDRTSALQLGFSNPPNGLELKQFLRILDCDAGDPQSERPYWMTRFFGTLQRAINDNLYLQDVAYFRHESGSIYRPIVVSVSKSLDGGVRKIKVLFIQASSSPLTDRPSPIQRLADGVRLSIRTKIEVVDGFAGKLSRIYREKVKSQAPSDVIARNFPVGRRVLEALETITEEARSHGISVNEAAPKLFANATDQQAYELARDDSIRVWERLKTVALAEDKTGLGDYDETERLLAELRAANEQYLAIALPRLNELCAPAETPPLSPAGGQANPARRTRPEKARPDSLLPEASS